MAVIIIACSGTVLCVFAKEFGEHVYSRLGGEKGKEGKGERRENLMADEESGNGEGNGRARAGSITVDVEMSQGYSR